MLLRRLIMSAYAGGFTASLKPNQCLCKEVSQLKKLGGLDKKEKQ